MVKIGKSGTPDKSYDLTGAKLYTATIVSVNTEAYEMRVFSDRISPPMEIPSLYYNVRDGKGSGIHIIPEVGAEVWIAETSDGTFVPLSYHSIMSDSYRNNRPAGIEGDLFLSTRDGNSLSLLRGGSVAIESSPVCKVLMDPVSDTINSFSSESGNYTLAKSDESICNDDRSTIASVKVFENADDPGHILEYDMGKISTGETFSFLLKSAPKNAPGSLDVITAGMTKAGLITLDFIDARITATSSITTQCVTLTATATAAASLTTPSMTFTCPATIFTGSVTCAALTTGSLVTGSIAVGGAGGGGTSLMSTNATQTVMSFGNPEQASPVFKAFSGNTTEGFAKDLYDSLNGLIGTVTALQLIVETIDATMPGVAIQDALDAVDMKIDAAPLIAMKTKLKLALDQQPNQTYITNRIKSV